MAGGGRKWGGSRHKGVEHSCIYVTTVTRLSLRYLIYLRQLMMVIHKSLHLQTGRHYLQTQNLQWTYRLGADSHKIQIHGQTC